MTAVVLMDYLYWQRLPRWRQDGLRVQPDFVEGHPGHFELIAHDYGRTPSTRAFRYTRRLDFARLPPVRTRRTLSGVAARGLRRARHLVGA